jgi:hypothetical protein
MKTATRKKTKTITEVVIGHVGVDSGQLMICDPCYIDSEWENEDFEDIRVYKNEHTGRTLTYGKDFANYEEVIPEYGKTMNVLISEHDWEIVESPEAKHGFSYNACAKATLSEQGYGELRFRLGHAGAGLAFGTAYGDGVYPVIATYKKGVIKSVRVEFF